MRNKKAKVNEWQQKFANSKQKKSTKPKLTAKTKLHPRNTHNGPYDLDGLVKAVPELSDYLTTNVRGEQTVKFADPQAVLLLNKALLLTHYNLDFWSIPEGFLCPPIPGRADYIHYLADLLAGSNFGNTPKAKVLDIGVGANCVYPIIGTQTYDWSFVGSEVNPKAAASAKTIVERNSRLEGKVEIKVQPNAKDLLYGIIDHNTKLDAVMCNPPFHASQEAAQEGTKRKLTNLNQKQAKEAVLNFGGQSDELWCEGGERRFISDLIRESKKFAENCFWYTTLVSKASNLKALQDNLDYNKASEVRTIAMSQGNKSSRILAWTFLDAEQKKAWQKERWSSDKKQ
ncbi:23S rRNA (adenine(1618)-N(6))-methyltransferase RlmF [Roseivirga pacifica]|uniref:23S rRNA (adenine(1618)-N(6))-methyltransferase RlmF n=1 Tax=Roseivirga pacifica TaxID=1267423 RepID=UPI003BAD40FC